jgi:hypothetical protein
MRHAMLSSRWCFSYRSQLTDASAEKSRYKAVVQHVRLQADSMTDVILLPGAVLPLRCICGRQKQQPRAVMNLQQLRSQLLHQRHKQHCW